MRQIKFTTAYEQILSFDDKDFKIKYEERIGNNPGYTQTINTFFSFPYSHFLPYVL